MMTPVERLQRLLAGIPRMTRRECLDQAFDIASDLGNIQLADEIYCAMYREAYEPVTLKEIFQAQSANWVANPELTEDFPEIKVDAQNTPCQFNSCDIISFRRFLTPDGLIVGQMVLDGRWTSGTMKSQSKVPRKFKTFFGCGALNIQFEGLGDRMPGLDRAERDI